MVKIDQQFVARLTHDRADTTVIAGITSIAHGLGLTVIAEGVETRTQHDIVRSLGCDYAQGYLCARPMNGCPRSNATSTITSITDDSSCR